MNAAPCSLRTRMNLIDEPLIASTIRIFSSPGRPKTYSTPSFSKHSTRSCATVFSDSRIFQPRGDETGVPSAPPQPDDKCIEPIPLRLCEFRIEYLLSTR